MNYGKNSSFSYQPQQLIKTCVNGHILIMFNGQFRQFPYCTACGSTNLSMSYSCSICKFDLCFNCLSISYNQKHTIFPSTIIPCYQNQPQTIETKTIPVPIEFKKCPNNHFLTLCESNMRFHHSCNVCFRINLNHSWTCFSCP